MRACRAACIAPRWALRREPSPRYRRRLHPGRARDTRVTLASRREIPRWRRGPVTRNLLCWRDRMRPQTSPSLNARGSPRVPKWSERPRIAQSPRTQPTTLSSRRRRGAQRTPRARRATQVEAARGGTRPSPHQLVLGFRAARPSRGRRIYAKRATTLAPASCIPPRLPPREGFRPARTRVLPPPRARRPPRATRLLLCATRLQERGHVWHLRRLREARPREARVVSPVPSEPKAFSATASRRRRSNTQRRRPTAACPARFLRPRPPRYARCPSPASSRLSSRLTHRSRP
mmetsp:Transcript_229/g.927  ORF Transcript_229/g.927 Transcript_229/m.927 type:complete len:290 (+) Transcript_229:2765-3634(+)